MSSRRFVDRGFWKCRDLNKADARTRLLFIYLFGEECDDFGRVKDDPYLMRRGCFSDDDVTEDEVKAMLDALASTGFVKRYLARDETPLLWLPTFHDYQPMGYWAISRLDRHPDDEFEAFDWLGANNKKIKTPRPLSPVGHEYGILHNSTEVDVTSGELRKVGESLGPNTYTQANTKAKSVRPGARAVAVKKASKESPPCIHPLSGDVLEGGKVIHSTTGMILAWKNQDQDKDFRHWEKLGHKAFAFNQQDPVTLLAHVIEINHSKRIKSKPATLLRRLTRPKPGEKRRSPANKWYELAKGMLNGTPTKQEIEKRKKSQPESLGEVFKKGSK